MNSHTKYGFSLIEQLIVVAIVAMVAVLSIAHLQYMDAIMVRAELNKLYATCLYAQRYAMTTNTKQMITFDIEHGSYTCNGHTEIVSPRVQFGFLSGAHGPPSAPHTPIANPITFKQQRIVFEPNGVIQPGTVYLVDTKKRHMVALSSAVAHTSFLRKYRYCREWVLL